MCHVLLAVWNVQREQRALTTAVCIALCTDQFRDAGRLLWNRKERFVCDLASLLFICRVSECRAVGFLTYRRSLSETDARFQKISAPLNGWHHIWLVQNAGFCVAHIEVTYLKCMEVHRGHVGFFFFLSDL